jgi:hypothetical protein
MDKPPTFYIITAKAKICEEHYKTLTENLLADINIHPELNDLGQLLTSVKDEYFKALLNKHWEEYKKKNAGH